MPWDQRLAKAYRDLEGGGGGGLLIDLAQSMTNSFSYLVFDPYQQPMLNLAENRGHWKTTTTVSWIAGQAIGSITLNGKPALGEKTFSVHDAYGRRQAEITGHRPPDERSFMEVLTGPATLPEVNYLVCDAHDHEIARITRTYDPDNTGGVIPLHILEVRYPRLGEPLSTLLRVATIVMHFAELRD